MRDDIKVIPESHSAEENSPRQLIASVIELLRQEDVATTEIDALLGNLAESLERCFAARQASGAYEDAMARAPWLTAEFERLNHQQASIRQSLQALRTLIARGQGSFEAAREMEARFGDFVDLYLEHEAAEHNFLETAYPGPDWTN